MNSLLQYVLALYPPCLVAAALVWLLRGETQNRLQWGISTAICGSAIAFAFLAAPWAFTSYYLRYAALALFALALIYTSSRTSFGAVTARPWSRLRFSLSLLLLFLFVVLDVLAFAAFQLSGKPLNLSFPLASGNYYVLQGGSSAITNPFHAAGGTGLAFDIVKLNAFGNRADGIAPQPLAAYEIFGERLRSPCAGTVSFVQDGVQDHAPGRPDAEHPAGNHLVLKCGDTDVLLAHLKRDTIRVKAGHVVSTGEVLGCVGNSGNTLEPHLHISATMGGAERALTFDNRRLSVNSVVAD